MNDRNAEIEPRKIISTLRRHNLLPAIVFLQTRRKCDEAAQDLGSDKSQPFDNEKIDKRRAIFNEMADEFPEITTHKHRKLIVDAGVGAHHAGHIPAWKLLVEKMMASGLLDAIFATSTVAAGVDFPARTVVISNADARGNDGWRSLTASELQQMTGRAGRRGRDNVGFAVLVPSPYQNIRKVAELLKSKPDALTSKFRATYTSLLNLLDAYGNLDQVREMAEKSFAFYHRPSPGQRRDHTDDIWANFERRSQVLDHYGYIDLSDESVTADGKWLADLRIDRPLLVGEAMRAGVFDEASVAEFAGLIASIASDAERNYGEIRGSHSMADRLNSLEAIIRMVTIIEWKFGVPPVEDMNDSAAAAAERWAQGMEWDTLVSRSKAEPGDLLRLMSRTGEALRQIAELRGANRSVTAIASAAADVMLREPIR